VGTFKFKDKFVIPAGYEHFEISKRN